MRTKADKLSSIQASATVMPSSKNINNSLFFKSFSIQTHTIHQTNCKPAETQCIGDLNTSPLQCLSHLVSYPRYIWSIHFMYTHSLHPPTHSHTEKFILTFLFTVPSTPLSTACWHPQSMPLNVSKQQMGCKWRTWAKICANKQESETVGEKTVWQWMSMSIHGLFICLDACCIRAKY